MTSETRHATSEELLRRPDDGFLHELVREELRKTAPAGNKHGYVTMNLSGLLHRHVKENDLGRVYTAETGFLRAPDVAFVSRARLEEAGEVEGYWSGAPDLAVGVISPSDAHTEVVEKVLVVDSSWRTVTVYRALDDIRILKGEADENPDGAPTWSPSGGCPSWNCPPRML
jgi:Uma2 family endonuclease